MPKEVRGIITLITMLIAALVLAFTNPEEGAQVPPIQPPAQNEQVSSTRVVAPRTEGVFVTEEEVAIETNALITRVIDGDTVEALMDGETSVVKVRFLGVDTPESVDPRRGVQCFGKEASAYTKRLLQGQRVELREDLQADDRDKYGRLLRNILREDGMDVNATLIAEGYAQAYLSFPLSAKRKAQLRLLQEQAKTEERGLWSPSTCNGESF
ncbi:thermonuclease family protein [Patescibacteria group bacterium]|nr:thermonuclease family protein [Patescibacteria group bacterium]